MFPPRTPSPRAEGHADVLLHGARLFQLLASGGESAMQNKMTLALSELIEPCLGKRYRRKKNTNTLHVDCWRLQGDHPSRNSEVVRDSPIHRYYMGTPEGQQITSRMSGVTTQGAVDPLV